MMEQEKRFDGCGRELVPDPLAKRRLYGCIIAQNRAMISLCGERLFNAGTRCGSALRHLPWLWGQAEPPPSIGDAAERGEVEGIMFSARKRCSSFQSRSTHFRGYFVLRGGDRIGRDSFPTQKTPLPAKHSSSVFRDDGADLRSTLHSQTSVFLIASMIHDIQTK